MRPFFQLLLLIAVVGCDGESDATAGAGGAGGAASSSETGSSSASGGAPAAGGGGAGTGGINGCSGDAFVAQEAPVVVRSDGVFYEPPCIEIAAGTTVTFEDEFMMHPLLGGTVVDGVGSVDPTSPIPSTDSGRAVDVVFRTPGTFGFYCDHHASLQMMGAVRVIPAAP